MATVTLSIPNEVKDKMESFAWINWSALARDAFVQKMEELELLATITAKSKLTEADVKQFADRVNARVSEQYLLQARLARYNKLLEHSDMDEELALKFGEDLKKRMRQAQG